MRTVILAALPLLLPLPALADAILPLDGTWTSTAEDVAVADTCNPALSPMLEPMSAAMRRSQTVEMEVGDSFDPNAIFDNEDQSGEVTWEQLDDNVWSGTMRDDTVDMISTMILTVEADDRMVGEMQMDVGSMIAAGQPSMAALAADCVVDITFVMTHNG